MLFTTRKNLKQRNVRAGGWRPVSLTGLLRGKLWLDQVWVWHCPAPVSIHSLVQTYWSPVGLAPQRFHYQGRRIARQAQGSKPWVQILPLPLSSWVTLSIGPSLRMSFLGLSNKSRQLGGFKQQKFILYSLMVLEAWSPKWRCHQGSVPAKAFRGGPAPASFSWGWGAPGGPELVAISLPPCLVVTWPPLLLFSQVSPRLFLTRTLVLAIRAHLDNPGISPPFKIIHLITPAKTPFSKQRHIHSFQKRGHGCIFWGSHHATHYTLAEPNFSPHLPALGEV